MLIHGRLVHGWTCKEQLKLVPFKFGFSQEKCFSRNNYVSLTKFPRIAEFCCITVNWNTRRLTMSLMTNPFVHFNKVPDETDVCLTGKENVNPSSLVMSSECSGTSLSLSTNSFSDEAIKLNRSCRNRNISVYMTAVRCKTLSTY